MKTFILCTLLLVNSGVFTRDSEIKTSKISSLEVDKAQSRISWHAEKPTGTHDGSINVYTGKLTFQDKKLLGGFILIDMQSLKVTDLTSPDKEKLENNLKGDNFFDTGRYTVARFDITNVAYVDSTDLRKVIITGTLTMHGITKKISFKTGIQKNSGQEFVAVADAAINRRDWNIATENFKYNTFISPVITLHILIKAA
ncbi:YceI family protein [Mucilaginibacter sp.]|uniref:YceI family protein n=1 Tax=Mucilaginibacter sp. TaxID=1882438 RepID=UPI00260FD0DE|nr:YceI family protein [Mucilaginibacter sp.]MDB4923459.1 YceI family protein [Mucilaginibacter sp.]